MSYPRLQVAAFTALAVLPSVACTIDVGGIVQDEEPGGGGGDGSGGSGPSGSESVDGKLSSNGLYLAPAALLALGTGPLTSTSQGVADLLAREDGARHLEYTALCALDAGTSLTVGGETYPGLYGLAPEWMDESCDGSCQRWVTACLLAHTNVGGFSVEISMRGAHPGMAWSPEIEETFDIQEAGFYGNLFVHDESTGGPGLYACMGRGLISFDEVQSSPDDEYDSSYLVERVCSTGAACGLMSTGPCYFPDFEEASTCENDAGVRGFYSDCHVDLNTQTGPMYPEVITTYLAAH